MKKFWVKLCTFAMILVMSAGYSATAFAYTEEEVVYIAEQYLTSWVSTDFGQYLEAGLTDKSAIEQFTNWQTLKNNMGEIEEVSEHEITETDGIISVKQTLTCTNDTLIFTVDFDKEIAETVDAYSAIKEITVVSANDVGNEGASLAKAGLNTVMSMTIVFVVLIFIALIIYMMRFIPVILDKVTKKKENEESTEEVVVRATEIPMGVASNDEEITAVITAAIMAYEAETGAKAGTFVVRSIKKRQK